MAEVSLSIDSIARKIHNTILNAVGKVGQNTIATACGVDNSTITGDKAKYWERFAMTLAAAGLKVVPIEARCYTASSIDPLLQLAKQRMAQLATVDHLQWEDPE